MALFCLNTEKSTKKSFTNQSDRLSSDNFTLNRNGTCERVITENCYIWKFFRNFLVLFAWERLPDLSKMSRYSSLRLAQVVSQSYLLQKAVDYLAKSRKINQNLTGPKNFDICFNAIARDQFLQVGWCSAKLCLHPVSRFS